MMILKSDLIRILQRKVCFVLLLGDFNGYTRNLKDYFGIDQDDVIHPYLTEDMLNDEQYLLKDRVTEEKHRPNNYGYRLIDLCKSQSLRIFNGRLGQDDGVGRLTSNDSSVVDYAIGSTFLLSKTSEFYVHAFDALFFRYSLRIDASDNNRYAARSVNRTRAG